MATADTTLTEQLKSEFAPVDLHSYAVERPPLVDLYHLVGGRPVLYCEAETIFTSQAQKHLLDNGVTTLYVSLRDRAPAGGARNLARLLSLTDAQLPPLAKAGILYASAINATRAALSSPDNPEHWQVVQQLVGLTVTRLLRSQEMFYALLQMMRHDFSIYSHSVNVCAYAVALGIKLGFKSPDLLELGFGALMHDIGKSRVPLEVLNKPASLTGEERALVQQHPVWGIEILRACLASRPLAKTVVLHHHERLDGSGYPGGLSDKTVAPLVRLVSVTDVYDALTSQRPYRGPMPPFDALCLMKTAMGQQLDERCFSSFVELLGGRASRVEAAAPSPKA